jgi:hypothetical protein
VLDRSNNLRSKKTGRGQETLLLFHIGLAVTRSKRIRLPSSVNITS